MNSSKSNKDSLTHSRQDVEIIRRVLNDGMPMGFSIALAGLANLEQQFQHLEEQLEAMRQERTLAGIRELQRENERLIAALLRTTKGREAVIDRLRLELAEAIRLLGRRV